MDREESGDGGFMVSGNKVKNPGPKDQVFNDEIEENTRQRRGTPSI